MQHQYRQKQDRQVPMNIKPLIKGDNKLFRVQNPYRSDMTLTLFFLFKGHLKRSVKKTLEAYPQANIIFDKVGGSWWKPQFHIIVGGKTKKLVEEASALLQDILNGKKKKK